MFFSVISYNRAKFSHQTYLGQQSLGSKESREQIYRDHQQYVGHSSGRFSKQCHFRESKGLLSAS